MKKTVKLFVIPKSRIPKGPPDPPNEFSVEATSVDNLVTVAREHIKEQGYKPRSISFGQDCLVAYAEQSA